MKKFISKLSSEVDTHLSSKSSKLFTGTADEQISLLGSSLRKLPNLLTEAFLCVAQSIGSMLLIIFIGALWYIELVYGCFIRATGLSERWISLVSLSLAFGLFVSFAIVFGLMIYSESYGSACLALASGILIPASIIFVRTGKIS